MINLVSITNEKKKERSFTPDHRYRILISGGSGSGKTNTMLNLKKEQDDIEKIYQYAKYFGEPKYEILTKEREYAEAKHFSDPNAFIECINTMDDVYENIGDYNPNRKTKILIVFDNVIADIMSNKNIQAIIKEVFLGAEY